MMLLRDTKVICTGKDEKSLTQFSDLLSQHHINTCIKSVWAPSEKTHHAPVIWLHVCTNMREIDAQEYPIYHANHEACVLLVPDPAHPNCKDLNFSLLPLNASFSSLIESLLMEEQTILQRNLFQSPLITDKVFERLHFYGRSPAFIATISAIEQFAETDASVFVQGETGTGKELTARSIHYLSHRKHGPFIPVNCGAFSDELILSELFGYEKGAFTGATKSRQGLLEAANGGTVFLDEVDSLSAKAQVTLLRFLQSHEVRPVGSHVTKTVDVRVVAATNQSLRTLVSEDKFREDLMYRLDVLSLTLPPLRERGEDIQLLAQYFLAELAAEYGHHHKVFSHAMLDRIANYCWPGNIRELENFIKRAYLLSHTCLIDDESLLEGESRKESLEQGQPKQAFYRKGFRAEKQKLINQFERDYLHFVLDQARGNISKAANIAQKERRSFCRLMEKHGLSRQQYAN